MARGRSKGAANLSISALSLRLTTPSALLDDSMPYARPRTRLRPYLALCVGFVMSTSCARSVPEDAPARRLQPIAQPTTPPIKNAAKSEPSQRIRATSTAKPAAANVAVALDRQAPATRQKKAIRAAEKPATLGTLIQRAPVGPIPASARASGTTPPTKGPRWTLQAAAPPDNQPQQVPIGPPAVTQPAPASAPQPTLNVPTNADAKNTPAAKVAAPLIPPESDAARVDSDDAQPTSRVAQPPSSLAAQVRTLIQLTRSPGARVDHVRDEGAVTTLQWRPANTNARTPAGHAIVTRGGQWLSFQAIEISSHTRNLEAAKTWTQCLAARGVRVLVDDQYASQTLTRTLGRFAKSMFIRCDGAYAKHCAALGHKTYPVVLWQNGAAVGAKSAAWFGKTLQCPPPRSVQVQDQLNGGAQANPTKPAPSAASIGERVRELVALQSGQAAFLVSSTRQGQAVMVTIHQPARQQRLHTHVVSADGRWLLRNPIAMGSALRRAQALRARVDCLARMGAAIFINANDAATREGLRRFGPLGRYLVRDCRARNADPRCRKLAKGGFPAFSVGRHVLHRKLSMDAIRGLTACP